jgi:hypothetical protein
MANPTVVLVHGAFADASVWRPVYDRLTHDGHAVIAPPNPLRGLPYDAAHTESLIDDLDGPVVLVGHSPLPSPDTGAGRSTAGHPTQAEELTMTDLPTPELSHAHRLRTERRELPDRVR